MNLIGEQRLHCGRSAAYEDQLKIQPLALVEAFFLRHHHREYLNARRRKRAADRLALYSINRDEETGTRNNQKQPPRISLSEAAKPGRAQIGRASRRARR